MAYPIKVPLPLTYYRAAHGDPVADLGEGTTERPFLLLELHEDGSVSWSSQLRATVAT